MTPEEAITKLRTLPEDKQRAVLMKLSPDERKGILGKLSAPPPSSIGGMRPLSEKEQLETTFPVGAKGETSLENIRNAAKNAFTGAYGVLAHPVSTVGGILKSVTPAPIEKAMFGTETPNPIQSLYEGLNTRPWETLSVAAGQAAAMPVLGEGAEFAGRGLGKVLPRAARGAVEKITKTGPKEMASLVKETRTGQAAADAFSNVRSAIETAREKANKIGNEKYNTVNESLNPIHADPKVVQGALSNATEALKGSHADPTLLKQMVSKFARGDAFTYEDLQGDYSRLGKELSKGTLPGDEYYAYDILHEELGNEMQRIADTQGMGPQLKAARDYWRLMKQTFGKPLSQTDAASGVLRSLAPGMAEQDTIANRIRLMGSFDPGIPKAFEAMQKAQDEAKGLSIPTPGETAKLGAEDIRQRKLKSLTEGTENVRKVGKKIINYGIGLKALWDAYHLNVGSAAEDVALGVGGYKVADAFARLLENPEIVEMLTKPTEADIAQIPPEMRGNLGPMLEAAKKKGIKVDPRLYAAAGATSPKKRVAAAMSPK